jgi:glycosyltransferase involved in cell wall biosynthesis
MLSLGWRGVRIPASVNNLWIHTHGEGHVSGRADYKEVDWRAWHPWTRDYQFPMAAVATPKNLSHPVRSYEPKVSVIIPVGPSHEVSLITALDSVDAQEMRDWEIVVVWDYRPDAQVLKWYEEAYPYVTWMFSNGTGPGRARNLGVSVARADYITFLDADDYFSPQFFNMVNPEQSKATGSVVYSKYYGRMTYEQHEEFGGTIVKDGGNHVIVEYKFKEYDRVRAYMRPVGDRPYVWSGVNILMPKEWHYQIGGFREDMPSWEDCLYLYRLAWAGYSFYLVDRPLWVYNFSGGRRREASRGSEPGLMVMLQEEFDRAMHAADEQDEKEEYAL